MTTTYTYDTNCRLSRLLMKTTGGVVTKYVYGRGLIGEETAGEFKTYHFDCRGSTVAITDLCGEITDTFRYDTYGKLIGRSGASTVIFGYNGRDGVVTDPNGLIYMRARYYSPAMKRFVNADIVPGKISDAITLNRFAYANGNPVSFVDPFGLSAWDACPAGPCEHCLGRDGFARYLAGELPEDYTPSEEKFKIPYLDEMGNTSNSSSNKGLNVFDESPEESVGKLDTATDVYSIISNLAKLVKTMDANVSIVQAGRNKQYYHMLGDSAMLNELDIDYRQINKNNLYQHYNKNKHYNIKKYVDPKTAFVDDLWSGWSDLPGYMLDAAFIAYDVVNATGQYESAEDKWIIGSYTAGKGIASSAGAALTSALVAAGTAKTAALLGTAVIPGLGTAIGAIVGFGAGLIIDWTFREAIDDHIINIVETN